MENIWERFNNIASTDEVIEAKNQYKPFEEGTYKFTLEEIRPDVNRNGLPVLKARFRRVEDNKPLYINQILQNLSYPQMTAKNIADAIALIEGLTGEEIEYTGLADLANKVSEIVLGEEYEITITYAKKDTEKKFPKIAEIRKVNYGEGATDSELPFEL